MSFDFPASPILGQQFPTAPVAGQPTYIWDGEKWKASTGTLTNAGARTDLFVSLSAAGQVPTDGVWSKVLFDTLSVDPQVAWDSTNKRFVPKIAGSYLVTASANITTTATLAAGVGVYRNGAAVGYQYATPGGTSVLSNVACVVDMNGTTDYIEAFAFSQGGAGRLFSGDAAGTLTYLRATLLTASPTSVPASAAPFDALAYNGMQVNGAMDVSQEKGTSGTSISGGFIVDRWALSMVGTMGVTASQVNTPGRFYGLPNMIAISVSAAQAVLGTSDTCCIYGGIEGYRIARLGWGLANPQPITIGFWTAHHRTGTYSVAVQNGAVTRTYVTTYTQNVADASEYKTITIPGCPDGAWDATNGIGMYVVFMNASGAPANSTNNWSLSTSATAPGQVNGVGTTSDVFRITGIMILPGTDAPSAARSALMLRTYEQELRICKRYWQKLGGSSTGDIFYSGYQAAGSGIGGTLNYEVEMRAIPTSAVAGVWASNNASNIYPYGTGAKSLGLIVIAAVSGVVYAYTADASCFISLDARI